MKRIAAIVGSIALWHIAARVLWIWNPLDKSDRVGSANIGFANLNPATGTVCHDYWRTLCEDTFARRTIANYNTDLPGLVFTHLGGALVIAFGALAITLLAYAVKYLYEWAFYEKFADEDLYVSECSDPNCRCNEHAIHDEFVHDVNRWVEKSESAEPVNAS